MVQDHALARISYHGGRYCSQILVGNDHTLWMFVVVAVAAKSMIIFTIGGR
jgi:hypothetical protein